MIADTPHPLTQEQRLAIVAEQEWRVQEEQYRLEISLRVQTKIKATKEVIDAITADLEKYEMILDELQAIRDEITAVTS